MPKTLQQILGAKNLTGVIQAVKGGVPDDILPATFLTANRQVEGDSCTYRKVEGTRKTARLVEYGSPSRARELKGVSEVPIKLVSSAEHVFHKPATLMNLTNLADESRQTLGEAEIARQTNEFKMGFQNLRIASVYSAFSNGAVYFDAEGNLLKDSTGAKITVDFGIPAGNKAQLDVFGAGDIIAASWATVGTSIHTHIKDLKKAARKLTGYPIRYALYGDNILDYFLKNTVLKEIINRAAPYQTAFASGEIPANFLGLDWIPFYEAFFQGTDDTYNDLVGADTVVFVPEPSVDWYELIEGSTPVPSDVGSVSADAVAALGNVSIASGMYSYAVVYADPVTLKQVAGDVMLPIIKVPKAVFIADVTP